MKRIVDGVSYPIRYGPTFNSEAHLTLHSLCYQPSTGITKNEKYDRICSQDQISLQIDEHSLDQDSNIELMTTRSNGVTINYSGVIHPCKSDLVLMFDGKEFVLDFVRSAAPFLTDSKDKKRSSSSNIGSLVDETRPVKRILSKTDMEMIQSDEQIHIIDPAHTIISDQNTIGIEINNASSAHSLVDEPDSDSDDSDSN